ncbi:hypothetical protein HPB50_000122 [Hyalomma asiaticum]|uniref:Uncharacterized protein n=1 Tax=Hyalomma asiaticum TaxID=266040 RepID=A0ACB7T9T3_HYAAI|nr:hypothetical protein HPB50_000122 [Hyalomma asiaticum]
MAKAKKLECWEQYSFSAALGNKFMQRLSPTALRTLGFRMLPVYQGWGQVTSQTVRNLYQEVIKRSP